jgi:hypothetical protein
MQQEESIQKPQQSSTLPEIPASAKLLVPLVGIPVALHALSGAAIGAFTLTMGALLVGLKKGNLPKSPEHPSRKSPFDSETTA